MRALLERAGYGIAGEPDEADAVVLETCAIRAKAEEKVFSALGAVRRRAPRARLVVAGCVAEAEADRLVRRFGADLVLGPRRIARLPDLLEALDEGAGPIVETGGDWVLPPEDVTAPDVPGVSAFVTVMQGCSNGCTFCVVPSRRGPAVSRPKEAVRDEVARLSAEGYKEVTLLGQNISYWGLDRGGRERLADLLRYLHETTDIPRIRFATSHPAYLDDRFVETFAALPRVMPHLHVPVQSGSDRILAAMRRGYTAEAYLRLVAKVRAARPETAVTTDLIMGFPGETEEDVRATEELCDAAGFDQAFVYAYSERPGTAAADFPGAVPPEVRRERTTRILERVSAGMRRKNESRIGSVVEVLVEGPAGAGAAGGAPRGDPRAPRVAGRTPDNRPVVAEGSAIPGTFRKVRITEATVSTLYGVLCEGR